MTALPALLVGRNLGQTVFRVVAALLVALAVGWSVWSLASGAWYRWQASTWRDRAVEARDAARHAEREAASSDTGAANATDTRHRLDHATGEARSAANQSAERIETHADPDAPTPADRAVVAPGVLHELAEGEARVQRAADRLQRAGTR